MSQTAQPIQIFKVGKHTAMTGDALSFSEADLQASAVAYDPSIHEAPLVVGHPKHDDPAYGWVKTLSYNEAEQSLEITPQQVEPAFAEMHAAGRFKKRSASFYLPDSPNNPVPGTLYLKHVGFLGAMPPAIKGLKSAEFSENEDGVMTVEFGESERWAFGSIGRVLKAMRDFFIETQGREEADKLLPEYALEDIAEASKFKLEPAEQDSDKAMLQPSFSEPTEQESGMTPEETKNSTPEGVSREKAELEQREANLKAREEAIAFAEQQQAQKDNTDFIAKQVADGKILPNQEAGAVAFMAALSTTDTVEFGEGDDKQTQAPLEWFKGFVAALPNQVEFGEVTPPAGSEEKTVSFAAPAGYQVDTTQLQTHNKIVAYAEQHGVDYATAAQAVGE